MLTCVRTRGWEPGWTKVAEWTLGSQSFAKVAPGYEDRRREGSVHEKKRLNKRVRDRERESDMGEKHGRERNLFLAQAHQVRARAPENAGITRGAGAALAWAASAGSCTARYTALLKNCTWFSHIQTDRHTRTDTVMLACMMIESHHGRCHRLENVERHVEFECNFIHSVFSRTE